MLGCVHHVLSNQPITVQERVVEGEGRGGYTMIPPWALALDWSRRNYHVNIPTAHRVIHRPTLGACSPASLSGPTHLDRFPMGAIKQGKWAWKQPGKQVLKELRFTAALWFRLSEHLLTTDCLQRVCLLSITKGNTKSRSF